MFKVFTKKYVDLTMADALWATAILTGITFGVAAVATKVIDVVDEHKRKKEREDIKWGSIDLFSEDEVESVD